jgi:hypothetical protein
MKNPAKWTIRPAAPKDGMDKSCSLILPTRPGKLNMLVSTVAVKSLGRLFADNSSQILPEVAAQLASVLRNAGKDKRAKPLNKIRGVSKDSCITLNEWLEEYEDSLQEYAREITGHAPEKEVIEKPSVQESENTVSGHAEPNKATVLRWIADKNALEKVGQARELLYEALEIAEKSGSTVRLRRNICDAIEMVDDIF